jgi:hypothetical protein
MEDGFSRIAMTCRIFKHQSPWPKKKFPRIANFLGTTMTYLNYYIIIPKA